MAETPRGLSFTPPAGLSATPPGLSATPPAGLSFTPPSSQEPVAEYEGFFKEIGEGFLSGLVGIGQGIGETGGALIDYGTGLAGVETNLSQGATDAGEYIRDVAGIDPSGFVGEGWKS